jgi:hypothetical protein
MSMKSKFSRFYALFRQAGLEQEDKNKLVLEASNQRTASLKELKAEELQSLEQHLQSKLPQSQAPKGWKQSPAQSFPKHDELQKMRKKVIALLGYGLGWNVYDKAKNKMVADMVRIYGWVQKYGVHNPKKLNEYDKKELAALITQVELMVKKLL